MIYVWRLRIRWPGGCGDDNTAVGTVGGRPQPDLSLAPRGVVHGPERWIGGGRSGSAPPRGRAAAPGGRDRQHAAVPVERRSPRLGRGRCLPGLSELREPDALTGA